MRLFLLTRMTIQWVGVGIGRFGLFSLFFEASVVNNFCKLALPMLFFGVVRASSPFFSFVSNSLVRGWQLGICPFSLARSTYTLYTFFLHNSTVELDTT